MSPEKPRISPLRSSKLTSFTVFPTFRCSTFSTTGADGFTLLKLLGSSYTVRPTIIWMMSSFVESLVMSVPTYSPSLMTVTLSVIWLISSMRWEMYTIPISLALRSRMILNSSLISESVSAAVGSSNTIILASVEIAFAISHICWRPTVSLPIVSLGSILIFSNPNSFSASSTILRSLISFPFIFSLPIKIFWATVKWFIMFNS